MQNQVSEKLLDTHMVCKKTHTQPRPTKLGPIPNRAIVQALRRRKSNEHFDIVDGEVAGVAAHGSLEPVLVDLRDQLDDVSFVKTDFIVILRVEVVQSLGTRLSTIRHRWRHTLTSNY